MTGDLEPLLIERFEKRPLRGQPARADFYLKAAAMHLQRAQQLADTEWKVSLAFWGALLASGISFVSYTSNATLPMTRYIAHSDTRFLVPYAIAAGIFLFTFSVNQATSIVRERSRYQFCQNQAAKLIGGKVLISEPGKGRLAISDPAENREIAESYLSGDEIYYKYEIDPEAPINILRDNKVWAAKAFSTSCFVVGIWGAAQWLAHGKVQSELTASATKLSDALSVARFEAAQAAAIGSPDAGVLAIKAAGLAQRMPPPPIALPSRCAFLECHDGADIPHTVLGVITHLEHGTVLCGTLAFIMLSFIVRASVGGRR